MSTLLERRIRQTAIENPDQGTVTAFATDLLEYIIDPRDDEIGSLRKALQQIVKTAHQGGNAEDSLALVCNIALEVLTWDDSLK